MLRKGTSHPTSQFRGSGCYPINKVSPKASFEYAPQIYFKMIVIAIVFHTIHVIRSVSVIYCYQSTICMFSSLVLGVVHSLERIKPCI